MSKELKLDKSTWVKTKLGELAEEISVRVENPSKSQYDRFVGLDCFVSGELKIKKWSETSNVNSSAKAFKAGDVLFARRNAYLKRASLVEFDGCCSGDAFVLRENHDKIVPGFLSFIVNSEKLWTYANSNAEGTMSKRVKWRDLANYEFLFPPKEQQAELAELLWAMDTVIEKDLEVLERLEGYEVAKINSVIKNSDWIKFSQVLIDKPQYGANESAIDFNDKLPRYIRITDIDENGNLIEDDKKSVVSNYSQYGLKNNDVLIARTGNTVGKTFIYKDIYGSSIYAGYLIRFKLNEEIYNPDFLALFFKTEYYKNFIKSSVKIGAQPNINAEQYANMLIPSVNIRIQNEILESEVYVSESIRQLKSKLQSSKALQKALINQVF